MGTLGIEHDDCGKGKKAGRNELSLPFQCGLHADWTALQEFSIVVKALL